MIRTSKIVAACLLLVLSISTTVVAGPLATASNAYNDGMGPDGGIWRGSAAYANGPLTGVIDFAVFTNAGFAAEFPGATYSPTANELAYVYQVRNSGAAAVSYESVSADPANNIGSFEMVLGDIMPTADSLGGGIAEWFFLTPEIGTLENSYGLAFSSPNRPEVTGTSVTINGGHTAIAMVPTPGDIPIPEPASLVLLCVAGGAMMMWRRTAR
jgi:hypothetical protein